MINLHDAIYALNSNVAVIRGDEAFDAAGNPVVYDEAAVQAYIDANAYKEQRAAAYPTIQEQLDMQYWDGVNGTTIWADTVASVKSENPKP
jgi:hypothetical protein